MRKAMLTELVYASWSIIMLKAGTDAIVSVGTTGESATLSHDEHVDVVLMTLDMADGRIPVIAGTGLMQLLKLFGLHNSLKIKVLQGA